MNITILSRRGRLYSSRRLKEEGVKLGYDTVLVDPLKCVLSIERGKPFLLYRGRPLPRPDVVLPRIGARATEYSIAVVRHFELVGVPCVNIHRSIERARNKLWALQLLVQEGVPVPDTVISRYPRYLEKLTERVGGTPLIMKLLQGSQGMGVIFADSPQAVESMLETIWSLGEDILLQEFVSESKGQDLRVLVIGDRIVAAMRRVARDGEFRSNIHRGGAGIAVSDLSPAYARAAVGAARAVGLRVAGVDILESKRGPLVIEVNASPGFQGLEEATGLNIAREIMQYVVSLGRSGKTRKKRPKTEGRGK